MTTVRNLLLPLFISACIWSCSERDLRVAESGTSVSLYYKDRLITSCLFEDTLRKPVFYPVQLASGKCFTRRYPLEIREGEPTDHPHHIGIWFTYGEVDGVDFWTSNWKNYDGQNLRYGMIRHERVDHEVLDDQRAVFNTSSSWKNANEKTLLQEHSEIRFRVVEDQLIIDRTTKLTAADDVRFEDSKEGMYAIRVTHELQQDQSGLYENSEGMTGDEVWGQKASWVILRGEIDGDKASVLFIDHPKNPGYPAHWMARGYGLFAVNPLGQAVYTNSTDSLNFRLGKGTDATFRYRIVLSGYDVSQEEIEQLVKDFTEG